MRGVESSYRLCALRVSRAFRTVSEEAVQSPRVSTRLRKTTTRSRSLRQIKSETRRSSIAQWQTKWKRAEFGHWTARLIYLDDWIHRKHGEGNFYLTQFLSGHGWSRAYLHRIGHDDSERCPTCNAVEDVEHILISCRRFETERSLRKGNRRIN